jgi:hypothetical protein
MIKTDKKLAKDDDCFFATGKKSISGKSKISTKKNQFV